MTVSRTREILLLLLVSCIVGLCYAIVWQAYLPAWRTLYAGHDAFIFLAPALMLPAWLIVSCALRARRCRETLLLPLVALLIGLGVMFLLRLAGGTYTYVDAEDGRRLFSLYQKQLISFGVGWAVLLSMILFWRDYRVLTRYKYVVATTAVALLLITTIFGHAVGGQTLTLNLRFFTFQPHDPVKLLLVIFMAAYLVEKQELIAFAAGRHGWITRRDFQYMGPLLALWLLVMAIIFRHADLGAALLLFGALLGMLYLGTARKIYLAIGIGLFILGGFAAVSLSPRVQTRMAIWQNPWDSATGKGYQICQSLMALGYGGTVGAGLAGGYPERIPAIHTDMIYAAIAEDFGLVGSVAILAVFLVLLWRIFAVSLQTEDRFGKLLA
ncbi:MAG TPA: FtsW/RodA/SpoVE family cell cycle protein, partial [Armatimonadota bacterium]